ncbi:MAG: type II toxin-antitoxin system RelE/ParE family toxin [Defluviitaleaceae bacterium]|nr:type II toxin-antitoxin system RelE/ParE family toxin [Defluviitaleaceae bacterium]
MKYKVILSSYANRDLARLANILEPHPNKAKRLFKEIEHKLDLLEDTPLMCQEYPANPKYRRMNLEGHALFYTVDEAKREINIYRVIYAKRDIERLLSE